MPHIVDETSCPMRCCNKCDAYRKKSEKLQRKLDLIKSGLSNEEKCLLTELICNEQTIHMIAKQKYDTDKYNILEQLKVKLKYL